MANAILADIEQVEHDLDNAPEPGEDIIFLPLPIPVHKALSDAAAKKNMTVVQLLAQAIALALKED